MSNCPDIETLIRFEMGLLPISEAASTKQHIESCLECREDFRLLEASEAGPRTEELAQIPHGAGEIITAEILRRVHIFESFKRMLGCKKSRS